MVHIVIYILSSLVIGIIGSYAFYKSCNKYGCLIAGLNMFYVIAITFIVAVIEFAKYYGVIIVVS